MEIAAVEKNKDSGLLSSLINSECAGFVLRGWLEVEESDLENGTKVCKLKVPVLRNGIKSEAVKSMQILLIGNECSCGSSRSDGKFGSATENAVMMYQDKNGLPVTGICDADTWKKLLGL
jgi:peptidoglycan hydrolase-like protein with peptidoglycan-binding domain